MGWQEWKQALNASNFLGFPLSPNYSGGGMEKFVNKKVDDNVIRPVEDIFGGLKDILLVVAVGGAAVLGIIIIAETKKAFN